MLQFDSGRISFDSMLTLVPYFVLLLENMNRALALPSECFCLFIPLTAWTTVTNMIFYL